MTESEPDADPVAVARAIVLRKLTMAPRTRSELAKALSDRQVPQEAATRVLDRFTELGLIDDASLAATFTESRRVREGWSKRAIATKLRDRGVDRELVAEVVAGVSPDEEERTALELARRRWPRLAGLEPIVRKRRLAGLLGRRGYAPGVVMTVVAQVEGEHAATELGEQGLEVP